MPTVKEIARRVARKNKLPKPVEFVLKRRGLRRRLRFDVQQCRGCTSWIIWRSTMRPRNAVEKLRVLLATRQTQEAAIAYAIKEAKKLKRASVYVCQKNGRYREERSFGGDPHPPKG